MASFWKINWFYLVIFWNLFRKYVIYLLKKFCIGFFKSFAFLEQFIEFFWIFIENFVNCFEIFWEMFENLKCLKYFEFFEYFLNFLCKLFEFFWEMAEISNIFRNYLLSQFLHVTRVTRVIPIFTRYPCYP